jgi:hypothetical protein
MLAVERKGEIGYGWDVIRRRWNRDHLPRREELSP